MLRVFLSLVLAGFLIAPSAVLATDGDDENGNGNGSNHHNGGNQSQHQGQHQSQGQDQGQSQSSRNTNRNTSTAVGVGISGASSTATNAGQANTQTTKIEAPAPVGLAIAPGLTAAPETCMGSTSIGASGPFAGLSIGTTWKSKGCELRMFARSLIALGYTEAALALLAQDEMVAQALQAAGVKYPGHVAHARAILKQMEVVTPPATTDFGRVQR